MRADATVRVIHRHRIGQRVFTRVSPLTYVGHQPSIVLSWLHRGDLHVPGVCVQLDPDLLRPGATRRIYIYDGETIDPRSVTVTPA